MGSLVAGGGYGLFVFIRVFYPPRQPSHDMPEVSHQHSPAATPKCLKAFLHFYGFIYIFIYLFYSGAALWHWAEQSTGRPGLVMVPPPQTHTPLSFSPSLPSSHSLSLSLCVSLSISPSLSSFSDSLSVSLCLSLLLSLCLLPSPTCLSKPVIALRAKLYEGGRH